MNISTPSELLLQTEFPEFHSGRPKLNPCHTDVKLIHSLPPRPCYARDLVAG